MEFVPEVKEWEEIVLDPFQSVEEKYVVCLDTMGQDREFTAEQKRFTLTTVQKYITIWEENVRKRLEKDRDLRLQYIAEHTEVDAEYEAELAAAIAAEIEEFKWEEGAKDTIYFGKNVPEEERIPNAELTSIETNYKYLNVISNRFS